MQGVNQWTHGLVYDTPDFRFVPNRGEQETPGIVVGDPAESPGAFRFVEEENQIIWNSVPHAATYVFAFESADEADPDNAVGYLVVASLGMDYTGANALWNQVMTADLAAIPNLEADGTYYIRIQAVPSPNSPMRGITPAATWGAGSPLSEAVAFTMPYEVTAVPLPEPLPDMPFTDVPADAWFYDAVTFVFDRGIMQGITATTFEPNTNLSRAMVATILYRMAGEPDVTYRPIFGDVASGRWYSEAVTWAFDAGVVTGFDAETFAPSANITREQFAAMMFRFAQFNDAEGIVPVAFSLDQFTDQGNVGAWAREAMYWSVYNELITGMTPTTIVPQGTTTRAQAATILMRYIQAFVD